MRLVAKTLSYATMHVVIASTLAYLLTGNWAIALGIGLLEPLVQTLAFPLHEWLWERKKIKFDLTHGHNHGAAPDAS
ncbi:MULTISPECIES: DUF2061 domain-containing protein [Asticcacaulis]|uniref:DUF2061 domain-containing protein n=1 Tax=Asticcacaulis TaxID=76890 RepID=UPI001AE34B69|nr:MULTISPECIES: DUF2061 domain-containing protein [Asticcacaulis]MBP2157698.1 putative membrane protein [Asticcacaulis solisilvae]MDR6798743.1 putative membrane protein [Asticcacaulis sp. BE141]